ncbi:MAG TPA: HAD-IC family P-type ATPase, partial [Patescibacteria group bacterium]
MLFAAAILSYISNRIFDVYFILLLLLLNIGISVWQENKADTAIKKLNEKLTNTVKVLRGERWEWINAKLITVGDIIQLAAGDVIPADGKVIDCKNASANEAAVTGESLPKDKKNNDHVFSGSFLATGLATIEVTATGQNTSFGKTIISVEGIKTKSILEQDIIRISKFLSVMSITGVIILSLVFIFEKYPIPDLLTLDLSLLIAGIPISLPTVMTLIIALGVVELSKKQVIVRRLSALEDLANVNLLLTDKTGTLTQNKIIIQNIFSFGKYKKNDALLFAFLASFKDDHNLISQSIIQKAQEDNIKHLDYDIVDYTPADSILKRSNIVVKKGNNTFSISLGAPQIIEKLCQMDKKTKNSFQKTVSDLAKKGYRALAIATSSDKQEKDMQIVGLLALSDEVRPDAKDIIVFLKENAIDVVMVTGDNKAITTEIARILEIPGEEVIDKKTLEKIGWGNINADLYHKAKAFAEILPEDKLQLVKIAKKYFTVATNGDGVNDLPAIKEANVGFAVANAVSSLKATAD